MKLINVSDAAAAKAAIAHMPGISAALAKVGLTVEGVALDENAVSNALKEAAATARQNSMGVMRMALEANGVKLGDDISPASVKKAIEDRISMNACEQLARCGVSSPVEESPNVDPTVTTPKTSDKTGLDRIRATLGK